jgi:hypothetical protein
MDGQHRQHRTNQHGCYEHTPQHGRAPQNDPDECERPGSVVHRRAVLLLARTNTGAPDLSDLPSRAAHTLHWILDPRKYLREEGILVAMTDGAAETYWPNGFFQELVEHAKSQSLAEGLDSERLIAMYQRAAEELTAAALERPTLALEHERSQRAGFEARLEARWGWGLDLFELTIEQAREAGQSVNAEHRPAAVIRQDQKFEALVRLHGRALMTAREVLVLLSAGYSSGALARWRTLHEIWVVFALLSDGDRELSRRYLMHDAVESMKAQTEYEETWQALDFDPPDWTSEQRDETRSELKQEFGAAFLNDYGWAAPIFGDRAPKFRQLQERARLDHWRGYYRMASHGTHANPTAIRWNIQTAAPTKMLVIGPSNAGLLDPAQCTLIALVNVTVGLLHYAGEELMDEDDTFADQCVGLVRQQAILLLMDRAIGALAEIHEQQEREEQALGALMDLAIPALRSEPLLTPPQLAEKLDVDLDDLDEALAIAETRGRLNSEKRYWVSEHDPDPET